MKIGTRVVLSQAGKKHFDWGILAGRRDPNRRGIVVENAPMIRDDMSVVTVLWDGRKSTEELARVLVDPAGQ